MAKHILVCFFMPHSVYLTINAVKDHFVTHIVFLLYHVYRLSYIMLKSFFIFLLWLCELLHFCKFVNRFYFKFSNNNISVGNGANVAYINIFDIMISLWLHTTVSRMVCCVFLWIGLWNSIFLWSNISLILLMPFAYFFIESQGLPGAKKVSIFCLVFIAELLCYRQIIISVLVRTVVVPVLRNILRARFSKVKLTWPSTNWASA